MPKRSYSPELFTRWLLLVYAPLAALAILLLLRFSGILPGWANAVLILLSLYAIVAVRLLLERRRAGLGVPLPRNLITGLAAISGILVLGVIFFILGVERLSSSGGLAMALLGGFLMILSVTVPTFRLVDKALRFGGKIAGRAVAPKASQAPAKPRRSSSQKPGRGTARHSAK